MNIQQRLNKLEQANATVNGVDLTGLVKVTHNADGTLTVLIGGA